MKHLILVPGLLLLAAPPSWADPVTLKDTVPHITTAGSARLEVVPDQADISLGIANERPTASAATEATAKAATEEIVEIKAIGIEAKDIKTAFDLSAQYEDVRDDKGRFLRRVQRGYRSDERITVRLHDVSKAGTLARSFIEKGANEFRGISFSYAEETAKRKELKAAAIRDALAEARTYTDAIGLNLGRVLQIGDESSGGGQADLPTRAAPPVAMMKTAVAIPTEPGVQTIREDITVVWEIEGKAH